MQVPELQSNFQNLFVIISMLVVYLRLPVVFLGRLTATDAFAKLMAPISMKKEITKNAFMT